MATFTKTTILNDSAVVEFIYDDIAMKLTGVKLSNNSTKYLDIYLISPLVYSRRIDPGKCFERNFVTIERPSYGIVDLSVEKGIGKWCIGGIEWRCSIGN
jgi:hypothetical protein